MKTRFNGLAAFLLIFWDTRRSLLRRGYWSILRLEFRTWRRLGYYIR